MASSDDKRRAIARVYAQALLDLAVAAKRSDQVLGELEGLAGLVRSDADLAAFLDSPLIEEKDRRASLEKIFRGRLDDLLTDTLQVLHRKGRLGLVPELAAVFRELNQERLGRVDVHVATPVALEAKLREELLRVLREMTGREPVLEEVVEPELLGGLVLRIGDRKIDGSVRREINILRERLHERAAHQILQARAARAAEAG